MNNLVTINVSNRTFLYYNTAIKILKRLAGGYMLVVGTALRFTYPVMCGILGALVVASFM